MKFGFPTGGVLPVPVPVGLGADSSPFLSIGGWRVTAPWTREAWRAAKAGKGRAERFFVGERADEPRPPER